MDDRLVLGSQEEQDEKKSKCSCWRIEVMLVLFS